MATKLSRSFCPSCLRRWPLTASRQRPLLPSLSRQQTFSSKSRSSASLSSSSIAAPEIDFEARDSMAASGKQVRIVPASPSYFTASPDFTDDFLALQTLLRRHEILPTLTPAAAPRVAWQTLAQYRVVVKERVPAAKYHRVVNILQRLNRIHPGVMPPEVRNTLTRYKRASDPHGRVVRSPVVDEHGRAVGAGRRKASTARAWLVEGHGEVLVNGASLTQTFARLHDRESALWALKATGRMERYNVWALVSGGGTTGQAESLTLAVARALLVHEPALKPALRRAGCVTRDPRRVERKKPGKLKARKMPAWVKR